MQTAVIDRPILSVFPSVHLSVTFRCFVQTNEDTKYTKQDRRAVLFAVAELLVVIAGVFSIDLHCHPATTLWHYRASLLTISSCSHVKMSPLICDTANECN